MPTQYTNEVLDHFQHPRNVGVLEDADAYARVVSDVHNDVVDLYIRVEDGRIADIRFKTLGCVAAIAATSKTTEMAKGRTLEEAARLSEAEVVEALGGLPEDKVRCSVLAPEALRRAVAEYVAAHEGE